MSVSDPGIIDAIAVRPGTTSVRLVVADHLDWSDYRTHALALQDKINAYVGYVESGQIREHALVRDLVDFDVVIAVYMEHRPTAEALEFLAQIERYLREREIGFAMELRSIDA